MSSYTEEVAFDVTSVRDWSWNDFGTNGDYTVQMVATKQGGPAYDGVFVTD